MHYIPHRGGITYTYFLLKPYFKGNHGAINLIYCTECIYIVCKSLSCSIYAPAPVSKFNTNKLTKMRALPQRNRISSQHNTQKLHTIAIVQYIWVHYSGQLFSGGESGRGCVISQGWYRRLKLRVSMHGQTGSTWYVAARPTGDFSASNNQASVGTGNKQHCLQYCSPSRL